MGFLYHVNNILEQKHFHPAPEFFNLRTAADSRPLTEPVEPYISLRYEGGNVSVYVFKTHAVAEIYDFSRIYDQTQRDTHTVHELKHQQNPDTLQALIQQIITLETI